LVSFFFLALYFDQPSLRLRFSATCLCQNIFLMMILAGSLAAGYPV